jgi:sulfur relay (sulfurtransferase) complex TusBCD TusD component (DsrE family)
MKFIKLLCLSVLLTIATISPSMAASKKDPLFVLLTSNDAHRTKMALGMSNNQFVKGHPLTIYLVDQGVMVGSTRFQHRYVEHQNMLKSIIEKGGEVYICKMCMDQYGVVEGDLIKGLKYANPDAMGDAIFRPGTQTLSW